MIEARVEGLTELRDLLKRKLPEHIQTKALQAGLSKAAQPIVREARGRAPVKTGRLAKAIYSFRSRSSTQQKAVRFITVRSGKRHGLRDAYYWRWLEFGRGAITAKDGGLGTPKAGFFGKTVRAVPARPFLRPAFESRKFEAIDRFKEVMATEIDKALARYQGSTIRRFRKSVFGA